VIGPQINAVTQDPAFDNTLSNTQKAWTAFKSLCTNFFRNQKSENYKEIVSEMLQCFQAMKSNMSLKLHFLHSNLDVFPPNLEAASDQHGKQKVSMLAEYCWCMFRDTPKEHINARDQRSHFKISWLKLTFQGRMLDISNAACTPQWPNVRYI
jgi:hypothetical protein